MTSDTTSKPKRLYLFKRLYTVDEAAHYLGISAKTIRNGLGRKAEKRFPVQPKKWGRRVVFDVEDLDVFADNLPHVILD
jgi:hypothetical protein